MVKIDATAAKDSQGRGLATCGASPPAEIPARRIHGHLMRFCVFMTGQGARPIPGRFPLDRRALVTAPAETDEGRGGIVELRLAGTRPPFPPFAFETVDVVAGRGSASVVVGLRRQGRQRLAIRGQGGMLPPGFAVVECDLIRGLIKADAIVRQVVVFCVLSVRLRRDLATLFLAEIGPRTVGHFSFRPG